MSTQHRTEIIKVLRQQMEAETDPQKKLEYAKQLAKLLPRPRQARRSRKPPLGEQPTKTPSSLLDIRTGSALDTLPDGERVMHHVVLQIEKKQRELDRKLTEAEKRALVESLSERDRAALEALGEAA